MRASGTMKAVANKVLNCGCGCDCGYTALREYTGIFEKMQLLRYHIAAYCGCGMDRNSNIAAAIAVADCNLEPCSELSAKCGNHKI